MRRCFLSLLGIVFLLLALPTFSIEVECERYWDSTAATYQGESFCWLSGAVCYQCYETTAGQNCSSNWDECTPFLQERHRTALLDRSHTNDTPLLVCRRSERAPALTASQLL